MHIYICASTVLLLRRLGYGKCVHFLMLQNMSSVVLYVIFSGYTVYLYTWTDVVELWQKANFQDIVFDFSERVRFIKGPLTSLSSPHTPTDTCNTSANWQAAAV